MSYSVSEEVEKANREFYDRTAERYDGMICRREDFAYAEFLKCVNDLVPRGAYLLDVGTGTGRILDLMKICYKTVGIDVSFGMLQETRNARVVQASCFALPFANSTFGGATAYSVLHHLYDVGSLFSEMYRVLRPGSWLVTDNDSNVLFHKWFGWWLRLRRFFKRGVVNLSQTEKILYALSEYHHSKGLDADALETSLQKAGFEDILVSYCHPPMPDRFTRILTGLETIIPKKVCRYYLRVCARKPRRFTYRC